AGLGSGPAAAHGSRWPGARRGILRGDHGASAGASLRASRFDRARHEHLTCAVFPPIPDFQPRSVFVRKVLVTGVTGFAGSHLVDYMLTRGDCEIVGIQRWRSRTENIEHFADRITLLECDLRDASSTRDTLERVRPDWIFHLAAQSFVPTSWTAPTESLSTNIIGQVNLFEAVRKLGMQCRIQLAC